jgi:uncharacterized membrane protein (UPF0127 family)
VVLLVLPVPPPWRDQQPALEAATMTVGGVPLAVEVARTPREQQRGLGYRDGLAAGAGMLFVYDEAAERSFWMRGMRFCLDIVWIADDRVVGATEAICPAPAGTPPEAIPSTRSPWPVQFVLEVPAGWMERHQIGTGAPVTIAFADGPTAT